MRWSGRPMRRAMMLGAGVVAGVLALREAIRRGQPRLRARTASRLEKMMAAMPEGAPPAKILRDLSTVREQTARILQILEEDKEARS